jgi:hypothetical protein
MQIRIRNNDFVVENGHLVWQKVVCHTEWKRIQGDGEENALMHSIDKGMKQEQLVYGWETFKELLMW